MNVSGFLRKAASPVRYAIGAYGREWARAVAAAGGGGVVLCYHRILAEADCEGRRVPPEEGLPASVFEAQLRFLLRHFEPVEAARIREPAGASRRPRFAVTFDDGYADNRLVAAPILARLGVPATFFVVSGYVGTQRQFWWDRAMHLVMNARVDHIEIERVLGTTGTAPDRLSLRTPAEREAAASRLCRDIRHGPPGEIAGVLIRLEQACGVVTDHTSPIPLMTWEHLRELVAQGFEIGAHTVEHHSLSRLADDEVLREVSACKADLEGKLGRAIRSFAYPYGSEEDFDDRAVEAVRRAGYAAGFSFVKGFASPRSDAARIPRICLHRAWPAANAYAVHGALAG
ncbi:MAG: polysaccharide deacetylase family protein [Betaproteobacteria bacterium]|nr:polysaccharide deacetylase family protein [Betaproteobacteria bacterium]